MDSRTGREEEVKGRDEGREDRLCGDKGSFNSCGQYKPMIMALTIYRRVEGVHEYQYTQPILKQNGAIYTYFTTRPNFSELIREAQECQAV